MKRQITTIALGILMISLVSSMYAGDSMSFATNLTNPVYAVTGNSSNLEGLTVEFENGNITISTAINYKPDNFTIIFFDEVTKEVERIVYRGGGRSRTKYVDNNVTVYVPEYINTTTEVEIEKIIEVEKIINNKTMNPWRPMLIITLWTIGLYFLIQNRIKFKKEIESSESKPMEENNGNKL